MNIKNKTIHAPLLYNFAAYQDKKDKQRIEADEKRINNLKLGDFIKLMTIQMEYFWVTITINNNNEIYTGKIDNILTQSKGLELGDFVKFHRDNIAAIMTKGELESQAEQAAEGLKKFIEQFNE